MTDSVDFAASGKGPANSRGEAASPNHFAGRRFMLRALCEELVGPSPNGPEVDLEAIAKGRFPSDFKADGPYVQMGSNEEILCVEPPGLRYGVGILYPWGTMQKAEGADDSAADPDVETTQNVLAPKESKPAREPLTRKGEASLKRLTDPARSRSEWEKGDEFNLSGANKRRPTSMAVSFLVRLPAGTHMVVRARGGRYEPIKIAREGGWPRTWWVRRKVRLEARFEASQVQELGEGALQAASVDAEGTGSLDIRVEAYVRRSVRDDERLITVCLINRTTDGLGNNGRSLFQASFDVAFEREDARECILPYPRAELASPDEEEQTLDLLYRDFETYAIGHGCASDWSIDEGGIAARRVFGIALPSFETSSITPDIRRADGAKLEVAMAPLAGLLPEDDGREALILAEEENPDIVILDWMLPTLSGLEVCRRIRRDRNLSHLPIIMLTARADGADRVRGLDVGADDYVPKPFAPSELLARVRAVLRRIRPALAGESLACSDLVMDLAGRRVVRAGQRIHLGPKEFAILRLFMENPGRVFGREQILDRVWGIDSFIGDRTVDVHIGRLRKALNASGGGELIRTVRTAGYALDAD